MTDPAARPSSLAGRVALVTGASGGIGDAVCRALLAAGVEVIGSARSTDSLAELTALGVHPVAADMADLDALPGLVDRLEQEHGAIDLLLPNAGTGEVLGLEEVTRAAWERTLAVNTTAPFLLAQTLAPRMAERGWGRILFTSSVAAFTGGFVGPHYAASKAALHGLVHFLAGGLAERGVLVNAIAPALIEGTGMMAGRTDGPAPVPVGRLGRPDEVADLVVAMLGNGYLTGKVVPLDGGLLPR